MKKIILSFALGFMSLAVYGQNETVSLNYTEIQHTYKINQAVNIVSPSNGAEFIKDNHLALGVVRVVLIVEHNTNNETYHKILKDRIKSISSSNEIGFVADSRQVLGRNGFELKETFKTVVFMSEKTAKKYK